MSEIQNPQNQPGMDKSVIIVFAVSMILLVLAQQFLSKPQPKNEQKNDTKTEQRVAQPQGAAAPVAAPAASSIGASKAASAGVPVTAVAASTESDTVVENDLYRITFTNRGAQVKSWILKKYKDNNGKPGLELLHQQAAGEFGLPLSLWTGDSTLSAKLNSALYVNAPAISGASPKNLSFEYSDGDVAVKKEFSFDDSYVIGIKTSVRRGNQWVTALPAWPAGFGDAQGMPSYAEQRIDYVATGKDVTRLKLDKKGSSISGGRMTSGSYQWVGVSDAYFGAIFLPTDPQSTTYAELRNSISIPKDPANAQGEKIKAEVLGVAAGTSNSPTAIRLFAGPKAVNVLESVHSVSGVDLSGSLDFGMFGFIGRPLFAWVRWTQQHWTPNWGWTIVLVTVLINAALLPLRISQIKSAMKMQKVAPHMSAIQEKYKKYKLDDPRRSEMNKEVAALYKEHDVNPVGGCLPLIIQMPFLFAFYTMLRNAIELRQAGWLYLKDLSAPDPWHIIPILTIVGMVVMQRMMPASGMSKEQQRMMNMMTPIMFAVFTWSVASGLGLYIITGTVVQILQQFIMNQTPMGREMRAMAEKRALKAAEKRR